MAKITKVFVVLISLFALIVGVSSFSIQSPSSGSIGDVKYSVLDPEKFTEINGNGWVLMDGREIPGTGLNALTGMTSIPDARGVFIRGMNVNRERDKGDADGNRRVGSFQPDHVGKHTHPIELKRLEAQGGSGFEGSGLRSNSNQGGQFSNSYRTEDNRDAAETRPRNITLYTYIKVSQ